MTEKEIASIVGKDRVLAGHPVVCANVNHLIRGQQDVLSINKSGYLIEYEIKISRHDFFRDAKKNKGESFANAQLSKELAAYCPNMLYYVVPIGLIEMEEVPEYAGLIYVNDKGIMYSKKKAPMIHKHKIDLLKVYKKVLTVYQERHFLGCCKLTYKNKKIRSRQ